MMMFKEILLAFSHFKVYCFTTPCINDDVLVPLAFCIFKSSLVWRIRQGPPIAEDFKSKSEKSTIHRLLFTDYHSLFTFTVPGIVHFENLPI